MKNRPIGILIIGLFFLVATAILATSGASLLFPGTALDKIWVVNEEGYAQLLHFAHFIGIGFWALGVVMIFAGMGLLKGRKWGWWLAVIIFAVNGVGDGLRLMTGDFLGGTIGICVAGGLLLYLTRPKASQFFSP